MALNYNDIQRLKSVKTFCPTEYADTVDKVVEHLTPALARLWCPECESEICECDNFCSKCGKALATKDI